ncbi:histidine kinase [Caballeronia peredens]|nr:histidine kinase [Caballeronia peredens]
MLKRLLPRTLRSRLTFLVGLLTSVILAASEFAIYESLKGRIDFTAAEQMHSMLSAMSSHLEKVRSADEVPRDTSKWIDPLHGHRNMDLAIFDAAGRALVRTSAFADTAPVRTIPTRGRLVTLDTEKGRLRYLVADVRTSRGDGSVMRVAIQYDRTYDLLLLRHQAFTIAIIALTGVVLTTSLAYGIAYFGLVPLRRLIFSAERMSSSRLATPLPSLETSGELKELENAFNGMLARLNESFTRLSQFSSNLAHDMRTPLTNLQAAAQVVLARPRRADDYREVIESSVDEYQRLSRMIEDMLFLARSERADARMDIRRLDARAESARVIGYYEPLAEDADVTIRVAGEASIDADLMLFQRALSNLLSNALAHAPKSSEILVTCDEQADITTIAVSDSGKGIPEEHLAKIFDRFYRVDPSRHNSASGTGLGLAIVRSIMDLHNGESGVESEPGTKTTFRLRFPKRCQDANR